MNLAKEVKHAGKSVKVFYDEDPINPRKEYDNITEIAHWHRRYDFGKQVDRGITSEEMVELAKEAGDPILAILPLYLYDHSGITISVGAFTCGWDSGQVGWVYITQSKSDMMGCHGWTTDQYENAIRSDVKTYDDYLTGQVFGYVVEGRDGETLESVWGFVGDLEYCLSEGKTTAEECEDPADVRDAEELVGRVTYASVV